jgi:hypothetical protein
MSAARARTLDGSKSVMIRKKQHGGGAAQAIKSCRLTIMARRQSRPCWEDGGETSCSEGEAREATICPALWERAGSPSVAWRVYLTAASLSPNERTAPDPARRVVIISHDHARLRAVPPPSSLSPLLPTGARPEAADLPHTAPPWPPTSPVREGTLTTHVCVPRTRVACQRDAMADAVLSQRATWSCPAAPCSTWATPPGCSPPPRSCGS